MKGVLLHGGKGARLRPLTHLGPKQLIPVANKPISEYALEHLRDAGIRDVAIVQGEVAPEKVVQCYGDGSRLGLNLSYIYQGEPRGIAHAIGRCQEFVGMDSFVVYLGDNLLLDYDLKGRVQEFEATGADAGVLLSQVDDPRRYGVAEFDPQGRLVGLEEKPKDPKSNYVVVGVYLLRPSVFDIIHHLRPSWRGELEITDALHELLTSPRHRVIHYVVDAWWDDTGTPGDILKANMYILDRRLSSAIHGIVEPGACIEGRVSIGKGSLIRQGSVIRGPVCIGSMCKIGPETYVGPYTSIGDGSTLIRTHVENSVVLPGVHIEGPNAIVDSLIGSDANVALCGTRLPKGHKFILGENSVVLLGDG